MKRRVLTAVLLAVFLLSACAPGGDPTAAPRRTGAVQEQSLEQLTEQMIAGSDDAYKFTDDDGVEIRFDRPFERIVCLYSAHTENLFTLGAGAQIIGGHSTSVYPPEAAFLPVFDYNGDVEQVIAAEPDLVLIRPFISRRVPEYVEQLRQAGITVVSLYPDTYEAFPDYVRKLAMMTGMEEEAECQLRLMDERLRLIMQKTGAVADKQTVFFESTETNIRTVTDDSMPGLAIVMAGGVSLAAGAEPSAAGSSIAEFGVEKVLSYAEDIDVYVSQRGAMNSGGNLQSIDERPGYDTIRAVREGRVYLINEKLISAPTFRYDKGVREMARFLYPELMDELSGYEDGRIMTKRDLANIVVRAGHVPVYVPSSSKYYQTVQKGHTYGLFEDISWQDPDFDYIETAVHAGYAEWDAADGREYFHPDQAVTREELARALFLMGDFENQEEHVAISDLDGTRHSRIVQILVDHGVFELADGEFEPAREVRCDEAVRCFEFLE